MNYAWCFMILVSFVCAFFTGRMQETADAMLLGAKESIFTLLSFAGVMCFWTGILKIGEKAGVLKTAQKLFSPVINRLFRGAGEKAKELMSINLSANLLGMGNAATPMGIKAMCELDKENPKPHTVSHNMAVFAILNTSSITLFPTTVIALRSAAGAAMPYDVIIPIWCASFIALTVGIIMVNIFVRDSDKP